MEGKKKKEKKEKEVEEDRVLSRLHLKMAADGSSHDATTVHPPITYSNFIEEVTRKEERFYLVLYLTSTIRGNVSKNGIERSIFVSEKQDPQ